MGHQVNVRCKVWTALFRNAFVRCLLPTAIYCKANLKIYCSVKMRGNLPPGSVSEQLGLVSPAKYRRIIPLLFDEW